MTAAVSPKKAVKAALGLLLTKVPECDVRHLTNESKKIRSKGGLPSDWSKGLEHYVHVKGGNVAMAKVRSKSKVISFTTIISTPAKFNLRGHLAGVSIDLEDDDLSFEIKGLPCLVIADDLAIMFAYGNLLGEAYCQKASREALAAATVDQARAQ